MKTAKYFSAAWCGPSKAFKPVMQEIRTEGYQIEFIDVDNLSDLAQQYSVKSVPTVVIEQAGKEIDRFIGVIPKQQVIERLS